MQYFDSFLGKMNDSLIKLIEKGAIKDNSKIAILGADEYSFAVRTLLDNMGNSVGCYVVEDEEKREKVRKSIKSALSRYFNKTDDYIKVYSADEWIEQSDEKWIVLYASKECTEELKKITKYCDEMGIHIYSLFNWNNLKNKTSNLKRLSIDEIKSLEKNILLFFDKFCNDNNLRYWVSGGSMLGAIRHKGFIPWDDDIDVFMPDIDYEKFRELFKEDDNLYCQIVDDENDVWGHYKFARLADKKTLLVEKYPFYNHYIGINVEILPIVGLPDDEQERIAYIRQYEKFNVMRREFFFKCSGDMDRFIERCHKEQKQIKPIRFDDSKYVGVLGTGYYERDCCRRSVYDRTLRMPFEDIMVNVPQGYQEYLDNLYGRGWEELPPESQRVLKHNVEAYWL